MKKFNVLIIILDTVRADHLSCYGYHRETTPYIDSIASEGTLYKNAFSASCWTLESLASIFSGLLPNRHGAHWASQRLNNNVKLIPEYFKEIGYKTFCLSNNDCFLNEDTGLIRGFDYFHNVKYVFYPTKNFNKVKNVANDIYQKIFYTRYKFNLDIPETDFLRKIYKKYILGKFYIGGFETNYRFKKLINSYLNRKGHFLGTLLYIDAHLPYRPPLKFIKKYLEGYNIDSVMQKINYDAKKFIAGKIKMTDEDFYILNCLYNAEISYMDSKIGEVYDFLKKRGILDSTMLIITSDHGENIGEHSLMDHRYCLYDTVLKVPLIIRYPDVFKSNSIVDDIVQTTDIYPTLLKLLKNDDTVFIDTFDGFSLFDRPYLKENYAFSEYLYPQPVNEDDEDYQELKKHLHSIKAIRDSNYKYILYSDDREFLFNIRKDTYEKKNIIDSNKELALKMKERLLEKTGEFNEGSVNLHLNNDYKKRLKALGYM